MCLEKCKNTNTREIGRDIKSKRVKGKKRKYLKNGMKRMIQKGRF